MNNRSAIYLDYNATAPVKPEVADAMRDAMRYPANPSSVHGLGRAARGKMEAVRSKLAEYISVFPREIVFTASGTEANNLAMQGFVNRPKLVSAMEHASVLKSAGDAKQIPVTSEGVVDLAALELMLAETVAEAYEQPVLVSVMMANNETGVIQPIAEVSRMVRQFPKTYLHVDAIQAIGKIPVDAGLLGCDMMTLSFHKSGGPVGAAALVVRGDVPFASLHKGGGQELGRRAGTENIPALAGVDVLIDSYAADASHYLKLGQWRDAIEAELEAHADQAWVYGKKTERLPTTSCLRMMGVSNETQLMNFDLQGIAVSAGSACSSGRVEPSHVLLAMGVDKNTATEAVRMSGGWATTKEEISTFAQSWKAMFNRLSPAAQNESLKKIA